MAFGRGRRLGVAGLNRRRGPKAGLRRKMATSDPPGAAPGQLGSVRRGDLGFPSAELARAKARIEELEPPGWSSTTGPRFFSQGLATCRPASGAGPGAVRDQLYALIKDLSAAEKFARRKPTTSAPEKATQEVQHLCQLAQLSRAGYYRHLAPRESQARRRRHSRCDSSRRAVRSVLRLSPDRRAIEARRAHRPTPSGCVG